jgi:hypothetical protein
MALLEADLVPPKGIIDAVAPLIDDTIEDFMAEVRANRERAAEEAAPEPLPRSGVSAAAPMPVGPQSDLYRIEGMTAMVPNPDFQGLEEQFAALRRRLRLAEMARDQARTWRSESELTQTVTIYGDPTFIDTLQFNDARVQEVIEAGQQVRKPPRVAEQRSRRRRRLLRRALINTAAFDNEFQSDIDNNLDDRAEDDLDYATIFRRDGGESAIVREFGAQLYDEEALRMQGVDAQPGQRSDATIDASVDRMLFAIKKSDFHEAAITREELFTVFLNFCRAEIEQRRRQRNDAERLGFGASSETEREELEQYFRETVESNTIASMLIAPQGDGQQSSWFEIFRDTYEQYSVRERTADMAALERYITTLVTGNNAGSPSTASPWAQRRERSLRTDQQVLNEFELQVLETLRVEATIAGVGLRYGDLSEFSEQQLDQLTADRFDDRGDVRQSRLYAAQVLALSNDQVKELRRRADARSLRRLADEETLRVARVRMLFEVDSVRSQAEAQIARYRYELSRIDREVEAPLEIVRESGSSVPLELRARLVPKSAADDAPPINGEDHTFTWLYVERTGLVPVQVRQSDGTGDASDTLVLAGTPDVDVRPGFYWVRIVRGPDTQNETTFDSARVEVRVRSMCLRCQDQFYTGSGERRVFGECEWRALPIDKKLAEYRQGDEFRPFVAALGNDPSGGGGGNGNGFDFRADLDDSIVDERTGTLLLDDRSLLRAANLDQKTVRRRYFEFESIVSNIARRFPKTLRQRYGVQAAEALELMMASPVAAKETPFIGAVFMTLQSPTTTALEETGAALGDIDEQVATATTLLVEAFNAGDDDARMQVLSANRKKLLAEKVRIDAFRSEILSPLALIVRRRLDDRLQLDDEAIFDAAAATARAQSLSELPAVAIVQAILSSPETPLRVAITRSERRFFAEMAGRIGTFVTAFRASSANAELITNYEKTVYDRDGRTIRVFGGAPLLDEYTHLRSSNARNRRSAADNERDTYDSAVERQQRVDTAAIERGRASEDVDEIAAGSRLERKRQRYYREPIVGAPGKRSRQYNELRQRRSSRIVTPARTVQDDERSLDSLLRRETKALADQLLATQSSSDIRTSSLWYDRVTGALLGTSRWNSDTFFQDVRGERRLAERLAAAAMRTGLQNRAQKYIDETYTDERESMRNELDVAAALGKPLGVPTSLWMQLGDAAAINGIAATARIAKRIFDVGGIERAFGSLDWRGVHSASNDQPTPYNVTFDENNNTVVITRGSERLFSGYDFSSINTRIQRLAVEYRRGPTVELKKRIERLALYYNVIAQFAPKLNSLAIVDVDVIEREMAKIRGQ